MTLAPHMGYDAEGICRIAGTLLRHVRPTNRNIAIELLSSRLGNYVHDRSMLWEEIDQYFTDTQTRRVA